MGVDAAQAAQPAAAGAQAAPVRQLDAPAVADHHVGDGARAVDEHADLAADLAGELGEPPGELVGDEPVGGEAALREALELLDGMAFRPWVLPKTWIASSWADRGWWKCEQGGATKRCRHRQI